MQPRDFRYTLDLGSLVCLVPISGNLGVKQDRAKTRTCAKRSLFSTWGLSLNKLHCPDGHEIMTVLMQIVEVGGVT